MNTNEVGSVLISYNTHSIPMKTKNVIQILSFINHVIKDKKRNKKNEMKKKSHMLRQELTSYSQINHFLIISVNCIA